MLSLTYEPGLSTLNKLDHKSNDIRPAGDNFMNKQWPRFGSKIYSATRFRTLLFVPRSSQFVSFEELRASKCELRKRENGGYWVYHPSKYFSNRMRSFQNWVMILPIASDIAQLKLGHQPTLPPTFKGKALGNRLGKFLHLFGTRAVETFLAYFSSLWKLSLRDSLLYWL